MGLCTLLRHRLRLISVVPEESESIPKTEGVSMATLNPVQETPNPVPDGSTGTVTLTFQTDPGTPDETADITIMLNGVVQQSASAILLKGRPAELTPTVSVGKTGQGWEITTDQGILASLGNNQFSISHA